MEDQLMKRERRVTRELFGHTVEREISSGYSGIYTVKIGRVGEEEEFYLPIGNKYLKLRQTETGFELICEVQNRPSKRKGQIYGEISKVLSVKQTLELIGVIRKAGLSQNDNVFSRLETDEEMASFDAWREDLPVKNKLKGRIKRHRGRIENEFYILRQAVKDSLSLAPEGFLVVNNLSTKKKEKAEEAIEAREIEYPYCFKLKLPSWLGSTFDDIWLIEEEAFNKLLAQGNQKSGSVLALDEIKQAIHDRKWFCIVCGKGLEQLDHGHLKKCPECLQKPKQKGIQIRFCNRCGAGFEKREGQDGRSWASSTICPKCWVQNTLATGTFLKDQRLKDVLFIRELVRFDQPIKELLKEAYKIASTIVLHAYIIESGKLVGLKMVVFENNQEVGRFEEEAQVVDFLIESAKH